MTSTNTMSGPIEISSGGTIITLIPNNGSGSITVTVSGDGIVSINGTNLKWDDGSVFTAPGTLTPDNSDGGLAWPPDAILSQVGLGGLSNPGVTDLNYTFYPDTGHGASIDMYFSGNSNTKTNILSYFASKGWEYDQDYFENNDEYHYVTDGEPSYNVFFPLD